MKSFNLEGSEFKLEMISGNNDIIKCVFRIRNSL
jgi:hypothetical protein